MIIYGSTLSPFVRKVWVAAVEKGLAPELEFAGLGRTTPEFQLASPFGKMPGFRDGDYYLADSSAILAYLDAAYPEPNLIPAEARARGRTIWFDEMADTILFAAGAKIFGNCFVAPRVLKLEPDFAAVRLARESELPRVYDYLEGVIPASGFLVEDRFTLADIAVASPFATLGCIDEGPCEGDHPRLCAYLKGILARPSFAAVCAKDRADVDRAGGPVLEIPA